MVLDKWRGQDVAALIRTLNVPEVDPEKYRILSSSANAATVEAVIQEELGGRYQVVSGDISRVKPADKAVSFYRGDAEKVPFSDGSFSAIFDWMGAVWHKANPVSPKASNVEALFAEYGRLLKPDGVVIIDESTLQNMRKALGSLIEVPGFNGPQRYVAGKGSYTNVTYVYRKKE